MALLTETDLEAALQVGLTENTPGSIAAAIEIASSIVETYVGRELESATYTNEVFDGLGHPALWLRRFPVTAVTSVTEDGTALAVDDDYIFNASGRILRVSGGQRYPWVDKPAAIVITYDAGYTTIPANIRWVATRLAARILQAGRAYSGLDDAAIGLKSIKLEGSDEVTFGDAAQDATAAAKALTDEEKDALESELQEFIG